MKLRLNIHKEHLEQVTQELTDLGIAIAEPADYLLSELNSYTEYLACKYRDTSYHIPVHEIIFIESMNHDMLVHTHGREYRCSDALYRIEESLNPQEFLRISNSVIISRKHVKKIKYALSQKFVVTLSDGHQVDVTRSYYKNFKNVFGI